MTEAADFYLGLDLGTSGLKGIALDSRGAVVGRASAGYRTSRPAAHAAEQDPADWIAAARQVATQLAREASPDGWRAIGLSAMLPTLVTASREGTPTGPAITWEDSRAEAQGDRLRDLRGPDDLYHVTGQWVDGRYLLPMFMRLAQEDPGRAAATSLLLGAKDYLFGWLTGEIGTDPSTASGYGCCRLADGRWDGTVLGAATEVCARLPALPPVLPSLTTRPLRAELATGFGCKQIPVCLGAADSVLGAYGLGVRSPGQIAYVAGTSTVILGVAHGPLLDPEHRFLVTPLAEPGRWGLEMDLLATGSALRWLAGLLGDGLDESAVIALAAGADPASAPVFLPYLSSGEQGALWDPTLRGTFSGLSLGHGRRDLARGMVSGIVLESRRCLAVLDEAGQFGRDVFVAGGSAAEPAFRADLADATGRRVVMPDGQDTDFSARGAALLAAQALGDHLPSAAAAASDPAISEPCADRTGMWAELWAGHERTRLAVSAGGAPS